MRCAQVRWKRSTGIIVDRGGEGGDRGTGRKRAKDGGIGRGVGLLEAEGAVGGEWVSGRVGGEDDRKQAEGRHGRSQSARRVRVRGNERESLQGKCEAEEGKRRKLLVIPSGALEEVGRKSSASGDLERAHGGRIRPRKGKRQRSNGEFDGFDNEAGKAEVADGPVDLPRDGNGRAKVKRASLAENGGKDRAHPASTSAG